MVFLPLRVGYRCRSRHPNRPPRTRERRKRMSRLARIACACVAFAAFGWHDAHAQDAQFEVLADEYIEELLAMNPELATALGDHRYDERLNDYTAEGVRANLVRERRFRERLTEVDTSSLSETNAMDYEILSATIEASIFALEELREHEWNPLHYNLGNAIYGLLAR